MISAQSRRGRRIVGSLERGTDFFEALRSMCRQHRVRSAEFRGMGALEVAELSAYDQTQQKWKPKRVLSGGLELLSLTGNISEESGQLSIVARATLMRDRDVGIEILGGRLLAARVFTVEVVVETFDDLLLRRRPDVGTGLDTWQEMLIEESLPLEAPAAASTAASPSPAPMPVPAPTSAAPTFSPTPDSPTAPSPPVPRTPAGRPAGRPHPFDDLEPTVDQFEPVRASVFEQIPRATSEPSVSASGSTSAPTPTSTATSTSTAAPTFGSAPLPAGSPAPARPRAQTPAPAPQGGDDSDEEIQLAAGDVIVHPKFRRCVVQRVEGNNEFVQVRLRNGRVIRLSLDVIHLTPQGTENGQRVFAVSIG